MSSLDNLIEAIFKPKRRLGDIRAQVTIEEQHTDDLIITEHPVEQGASISDHAYKRPAEVTVRVGWSNSGLQSLGSIVTSAYSAITGSGELKLNYVKDVYAKLLKLQESRIPFDIVTGKRSYKNMLFRSLAVTTDQTTEHTLLVTAVCAQVIMVNTRVVIVPPRENQKTPDKNAPVEDKGTKQPQKSGLFTLFGGGK